MRLCFQGLPLTGEYFFTITWFGTIFMEVLFGTELPGKNTAFLDINSMLERANLTFTPIFRHLESQVPAWFLSLET